MLDKEKGQGEVSSQTPSQEASLDLIHEIGTVPSSSVSPSNHFFDDINVPIVICKGVRSCTQHPIFDFVSLSHLSLSFRNFSSSLSLVLVPRNVLEALSQPHWKAVIEEVRKLENNHMW